jgi:Protein of unknown function (DUF4435)
VDALNTLSRFYRVNTLVYVEGDEDVPFWKRIFDSLSDIEIEIQSVGGSEELDKYIDILIGEGGDFVAARDADYLRILGSHVEHPRVIYTYGHSIENTIYTMYSVSRLASIWCKAQKAELVECKRWWDEFAGSFAKLLTYDVANDIQKDGLSVLGDNCTKFMRSEKSPNPDKDKIAVAEDAVSKKIKKSNLNMAEKAIKDSKMESHALIRGHFLASGVIKYISDKLKKAGKSAGISYDALYSSALAGFESGFNDQHPHFRHYEMSIRNVESDL